MRTRDMPMCRWVEQIKRGQFMLASCKRSNKTCLTVSQSWLRRVERQTPHLWKALTSWARLTKGSKMSWSWSMLLRIVVRMTQVSTVLMSKTTITNPILESWRNLKCAKSKAMIIKLLTSRDVGRKLRNMMKREVREDRVTRNLPIKLDKICH